MLLLLLLLLIQVVAVGVVTSAGGLGGTFLVLCQNVEAVQRRLVR